MTVRSEGGVEATLIIDFPEVRYERQRDFAVRKRLQNAEEDSIHDTLERRGDGSSATGSAERLVTSWNGASSSRSRGSCSKLSKRSAVVSAAGRG
jgi:hypothetical protein